MNARPALVTCAAGLLLLSSAAATAADPEAGRYAAQTCMGCHGVPGSTNVYPTYHVPKLGGQNEQYLTDALNAYRAGDRDHPTMQAQARALSEEDIRDIAAYFANLDRP